MQNKNNKNYHKASKIPNKEFIKKHREIINSMDI